MLDHVIKVELLVFAQKTFGTLVNTIFMLKLLNMLECSREYSIPIDVHSIKGQGQTIVLRIH